MKFIKRFIKKESGKERLERLKRELEETEKETYLILEEKKIKERIKENINMRKGKSKKKEGKSFKSVLKTLFWETIFILEDIRVVIFKAIGDFIKWCSNKI